MATCKDCIHFEACKSCWCSFWENKEMTEDDRCKMFKDKARFIELPFAVGDTVYIPWRWDGQQGVAFAKVEEINIYDNKNHFMFLIDLQSDDEEFSQKYDGWKTDKSIGETVFLTPEEAETALAEKEEGAE